MWLEVVVFHSVVVSFTLCNMSKISNIKNEICLLDSIRYCHFNIADKNLVLVSSHKIKQQQRPNKNLTLHSVTTLKGNYF